MGRVVTAYKFYFEKIVKLSRSNATCEKTDGMYPLVGCAIWFLVKVPLDHPLQEVKPFFRGV